MTFHFKDMAGGGLFVVVGLLTCLYAGANLEMGAALRMGPGYFPFVLGLILIGLGAAIAATGVAKGVGSGEPGVIGPIPWRAVALISLAPVVFALTIAPLGLAPSTALACFVACLASGKVTLVRTLLLTAGLTAICLLIFSFGLNVSMPLLGPWLR